MSDTQNVDAGKAEEIEVTSAAPQPRVYRLLEGCVFDDMGDIVAKTTQTDGVSHNWGPSDWQHYLRGSRQIESDAIVQ